MVSCHITTFRTVHAVLPYYQTLGAVVPYCHIDLFMYLQKYLNGGNKFGQYRYLKFGLCIENIY